MLRLSEITKIYKVASSEVKALNNVSINFRKNEFVSILGPSGSGKTTLLNIVGGLDKYTSGDLIIAGKSTKDFKDRDWDFYRNQRIGFIFQSYNLIPHQTVLANVELALTISGVSKTERVERAKEALDKVGLSDQYYKKPNQLSGGQCQRVAIARALVNNPEILLADEPTGALDTKTSEQIMQLIKEISKDRLVIMVTHNPDIASRYSSRIISLLDGQVVEDTNPFKNEEEMKEISSLDDAEINKTSKAKMGLITANKLSFKNLISKKGRTILVSIASSIGIIGISTVLAVSFGVTNYVNGMQDDMLSSYPVKITEQAIDVNALISGLSTAEKQEVVKFDIKTQVGMESLIDYLMDKYHDVTNIKTNIIDQTLVDYIDEMPKEYLSAKDYDYGVDVTNNIFTTWVPSIKSKETPDKEHPIKMSTNGLTQRYIAELDTVPGFKDYAKYVNLFTDFMKQLPGEEEYILSQYDLMGNSSFAQNENEMMIVLSPDNTLTDLLLGQLGYYDHDSFLNIGQKAVKIYSRSEFLDQKGLKQKLEEKIITQAEYDKEYAQLTLDYPYDPVFDYTTLLGKEFYYVPHATLWDYSTVESKTSMTGSIMMMSGGQVYYFLFTNLLGYDVLAGYHIDMLGGGEPEMEYFIRKPSESRDPVTFFDGQWAQIESATSPNPTGIILSIDGTSKTASIIDTKGGAAPINFTNINAKAEETGVDSAYNYPAEGKAEWFNEPEKYGVTKMKIAGILKPKETTKFGSLSRGIYYTKALTDKYIADANKPESKIINDEEHGFKQWFTSNQADNNTYKAFVTFQYIDCTKEYVISDKRGTANALNSDTTSSVQGWLGGLLGGSSTFKSNQSYMRSVSGLKVTKDGTDYSFDKLPDSISFYPKDFALKDKVTSYLDRWNADEPLTIKGRTVKHADRPELTYTDTVAMIISVINSLITIVTSALIAFTSLSLVVSCFMIAVITYISVMERVKEIGVIRSLGGRKKDVSRLFTAENFMTGLASGLIGIGVTYILSIIINVVVHFLGAPGIAALPWWMAILMVLLAILLNVISGFIPSRNASKQDPVEALRSE